MPHWFTEAHFCLHRTLFMTTESFTCPHCGTVTEYSYCGIGSYDQLFADSPETVTVTCRQKDCRKPVGTVREY